jgi:hypothetical protein
MPGSISAPSQEAEASSVPTTSPKSLDLSAAIATITSAAKVYTESKLPPKLPTPYRRWKPEMAPDAPHDPHSYFPMLMYK